MPSLSNEKNKKVANFKSIIVVIIMILDLVFLPWISTFPGFIFEYKVEAADKWLSFGVINSIKEMFTDGKARGIFLFLQIPVAALIFYIIWNTDKLVKNKKKAKGETIGGPGSAGSGQHGTSRFMSEKEKDQSCHVWYTNKEVEKSGIVFGMDKCGTYDKVWMETEDLHTLIFGATRSGKSRRLILPSIWTIAKAGESMVLGDPKGELYITSKDYLKNMGYNVIVINLREPQKGNQWNIIDPVCQAVDKGDIAKATELAWDIANIFTNQSPNSNMEPIWQNGEESTIAALILLAAMESEYKFQRHMTTVYYLLAEYGVASEDDSLPLNEYISKLDVKHPAKGAFATARVAPVKTRGSFFTTALSDLRLFSDPNISDMTSKQDHDMKSVGVDKTAVFLIVPDEKATRNVLATLYIDQLYQSLVELANKNGGRIPRRVNMLLDEFGNLPPIPQFDKKLTVAGGRGIKFTIAIQDFSQLEKLYDKSAKTLTGNCHNWIYLLTADPDTAEMISKKTGQYTVQTENVSSNVQSTSHSVGSGVSLTGRPLYMADEILRYPEDKSLVLRVRKLPAEFPLHDLSKWEANEEFGFHTSDRDVNQEIIKDRWDNVPERPIEEAQIWLPQL